MSTNYISLLKSCCTAQYDINTASNCVTQVPAFESLNWPNFRLVELWMRRTWTRCSQVWPIGKCVDLAGMNECKHYSSSLRNFYVYYMWEGGDSRTIWWVYPTMSTLVSLGGEDLPVRGRGHPWVGGGVLPGVFPDLFGFSSEAQKWLTTVCLKFPKKMNIYSCSLFYQRVDIWP